MSNAPETQSPAHQPAKPPQKGNKPAGTGTDGSQLSALQCGSLPMVSPGVAAEGGPRSPIDVALCEPELAYAPPSAEHQLLDTHRFQTGAADITPAVGAACNGSPTAAPMASSVPDS